MQTGEAAARPAAWPCLHWAGDCPSLTACPVRPLSTSALWHPR